MTQSGSPTVEKVLKGNLCSGCGLCAGLTRTSMVVDKAGFNRPRIDRTVSPGTEAAIAESCPGAVVAPWEGNTRRHEYWGPYRTIRTGYAADERLRHHASSGGALTSLLVHALGGKFIDAVVEIVADPKRPTRNLATIAATADDIFKCAGSRYAPSSPLENVLDLLERTDRLAFVGKPCDVSALRLLGRRDARVAERFPLMLSFFCAGIPSLNRSDAVVRAMGLDPDALESFRYRGDGWPGEAAGISGDGESAHMSYADSWGAILSKEIQFRCKICPDAVGGSADIACADAWHCDDSGYPVFQDLPGRSLVVARSEAGARLLHSAARSGSIILDDGEVQPREVGRMQPGQTRKKRLVRARTAALRTLLRPVPIMRGLCVRQASVRAPMAEKAKNFLGTVKRVITGKM